MPNKICLKIFCKKKKGYRKNSEASKNSAPTGGVNVPTKYLDRMCLAAKPKKEMCNTVGKLWFEYYILCVNAGFLTLVINHGWGNKPAKLRRCVIA